MRDDMEALALRYGLPFVVALLVVAVRALFGAKRWSLLGILRGFMLAWLVAWLLPPWLDQPSLGLEADERWLFVAVAAVFIEDFFLGAIKLGGLIRENPTRALQVAVAFILRRK